MEDEPIMALAALEAALKPTLCCDRATDHDFVTQTSYVRLKLHLTLNNNCRALSLVISAWSRPSKPRTT